MSSKYPILGNRPIDQWKVTELKEELKKRKLTTKGLKDDLIKRLHESIKAEYTAQVEEPAEPVEPQPEETILEKETATNAVQESETFNENLKTTIEDLQESNRIIEAPTEDALESKTELPNEEQQQTAVICDLNTIKGEHATPMEQQDGNINGGFTEMEDSKEAMVRDETMDSTATNQVSEVHQTLGLCDSVSADSVSIIEKNELKGNDTVELELDVVKPEKNESVDFGDSEKLNLDRSSGDESEEDIAVDFKDVNENNDTHLANDADALNETNVATDEGIMLSVSEKRKLHDDDSNADIEPPKKQPRWNSDESVRNAHSSPPNEAPTRVFALSDSSISEEAKKERIVPPSQKPPTNSVKIDRFLRPFTLKAVQELLAKSGTVEKFWMDSIKTHCFVSYASVDEATATREALYNLKWPPNGGRNLTVDFVDPEEVLTRVENPGKPVESVSGERQVVQRQRVSSPAPPPAKEKEEAPMVTLDDLFRKTVATPRIYYLPLSEEQVKCKIADKSDAVLS